MAEPLGLFGYVVVALRASDVPTAYALIRFVVRGYKLPPVPPAPATSIQRPAQMDAFR